MIHHLHEEKNQEDKTHSWKTHIIPQWNEKTPAVTGTCAAGFSFFYFNSDLGLNPHPVAHRGSFNPTCESIRSDDEPLQKHRWVDYHLLPSLLQRQQCSRQHIIVCHNVPVKLSCSCSEECFKALMILPTHFKKQLHKGQICPKKAINFDPRLLYIKMTTPQCQGQICPRRMYY